MKGMTKTKRVGGKGIYMRPTETSYMQPCRGRAVMHHTVRQSRIYHSCTHKISENTTIKMNSDTNIMLKDDQNSIQVRESTCQAE